MRTPGLLALALSAALVSAPAVAVAQPSTVILVRHAEKGTTPANDPDLTPAGIQRALDLAAVLSDAHVGSIITTQLQRTQLTAAAVMKATGLSPIVVRAGGPGHADSVAAAVRRRPAGEVVLVVGHSNTIPAIIAALGGPKLPDLCDTQYSMLFVLDLSGATPRLIKAHYGAADSVDSCTAMK
jgi:broad specificity phosphatase PhoE